MTSCEHPTCRTQDEAMWLGTLTHTDGTACTCRAACRDCRRRATLEQKQRAAKWGTDVGRCTAHQLPTTLAVSWKRVRP